MHLIFVCSQSLAHLNQERPAFPRLYGQWLGGVAEYACSCGLPHQEEPDLTVHALTVRQQLGVLRALCSGSKASQEPYIASISTAPIELLLKLDELGKSLSHNMCIQSQGNIHLWEKASMSEHPNFARVRKQEQSSTMQSQAQKSLLLPEGMTRRPERQHVLGNIP